MAAGGKAGLVRWLSGPGACALQMDILQKIKASVAAVPAVMGAFCRQPEGLSDAGAVGRNEKLDKQAKPAIMPQAKEEGGRISQNGNQTAGRGRRNNEFGRAARHR